MNRAMERSGRHRETLIVGGGQAGLAMGRALSRRGREYLILDAAARVGDAWRKRWDSLHLFTPNRFNALPGMSFPGPAHEFAGKDQVADYLEAYAAEFDLALDSGVEVTRLSREGARFVLDSSSGRFTADNVVVATGPYRAPKIPPFAGEIAPRVRQMHSSEYRRPSQLRSGGVLVVGAGTSGAEISIEAARAGHRTWLSGRDVGTVPFHPHTTAARLLLLPLLRFAAHHVLNTGNPLGRKARPKLLATTSPLVDVRPADIAAAGVERVPRTLGARDGRPLLEDGRVLEVENVVWCTGFRPDYAWIALPVFGEDGKPRHRRGIVESAAGLYFVGLFFQRAMTSSLLTGVGRDCEFIAERIVAG